MTPKIQKPKLKAIIFDVGGVLALPKRPIKTKKGVKIAGVHSFIAKKLNISLDQWFDAIDSSYSLAIEGKISADLALSVFSRNLGKSPRRLKKIIIKSYTKHFKQNKKLYKIAFNLKKQGYKIAILSDQWGMSKQAIMPEKYTRKFDVVVVSCDVGMRKPNPEIYKLTLKRLKVRPKEALFIDNQSWNIKPAKKLGIHTILFKDNKQLFKQLLKWG